MFMTPHSHLDHFHAGTRTQRSEKRAPRTTHCRADLFKSQELCLSFPYILLAETFGSEPCWVFFSSVCCMHMYVRDVHVLTRGLIGWSKNSDVELLYKNHATCWVAWILSLFLLFFFCLSLTCVFPHFLTFSLSFFFLPVISSSLFILFLPPTSVLQLRLQQRRTREQLADQGIMPRE